MSVEQLYTPTHRRHIDGLRRLPATVDREGLRLGEQYVMFFAEDELMRIHAAALLAGKPGADVLEVGLGLGVFAAQTSGLRPRSYTAIEIHEDVAALTQKSVLDHLGVPVTVHAQPWQLVPFGQSTYDAIMYDTWPPDGLADDDFARFIEHVALPRLRPGGRLSFFCSGTEIGERRAQILDDAFRSWSVRRYTLPSDRTPRGWTKPTRDFVIPVATKEGS
jgi:spermidine synthase